jgi:hypothetical protein
MGDVRRSNARAIGDTRNRIEIELPEFVSLDGRFIESE